MNRLSLFALLGCLLAAACAPAVRHPDLGKRIGDRAPIFSAATSRGTLMDYDRDYYGRHHLVLTFFPAAYTPV